MNRIATTLAFGLMLTGQAFAQAGSITITPEQDTTIHNYVVREKVKQAQIRGQMAVGSQIPADVELMTVPQAWGPSFNSYRYVYANDHVMLVEPSSRRVMHIITGANPAGTQTQTDGIKRDGGAK